MPDPVSPVRPIIVEGPDGAGKSTLADQISQATGRKLIHTGGPTTDEADAWSRCDLMEANRGKPVVYDRVTPISDAIYRRADGRKLVTNVGDMHEFLLTLNPLVIYCRLRDQDAMLRNIVDSKKAHKPPEYLEKVKEVHPKIVEGYDLTMALLVGEGMTMLKYDWQSDDLGKVLEICKCAG